MKLQETEAQQRHIKHGEIRAAYNPPPLHLRSSRIIIHPFLKEVTPLYSCRLSVRRRLQSPTDLTHV